MRFTDFKFLPLFEMAVEALDGLKSVISSKIKELPADESTIKTLREIEDLLRDVNAGGRKGLIDKDLKSIPDPVVHRSQKMLARYILSIDATPEQRNEFFSLWRSDKIVNKDQLFSGDRVGFSEVFNGYDTNPLIQEFIDDIMKVDALGHGKGEFGLNVLSKTINQPADNKGDLKIEWNKRTWQVECKTATKNVNPETGKSSWSSARFGDQEVRPAEGWEEAARKLNDFVRATGSFKSRKGYKIALSGSGVSLKNAVDFCTNATPADRTNFMVLARKVLGLIFGSAEGGRQEYKIRLKKNINAVLTAIESGDSSGAAQAYSLASFNYYMAKKEDDGVLFINLGENTFVWYNSAEALRDKGLRLHADTVYLSGTKDPVRTAYPQIYVQPTTFGGETAGKELNKLKFSKRTDMDTFKQNMITWAGKLARMRGVNNQRVINGMAVDAVKLRIEGQDTNAIIAALEEKYPQLKVPVARQIKAPVAQPAEEPSIAAEPQPAAV